MITRKSFLEAISPINPTDTLTCLLYIDSIVRSMVVVENLEPSARVGTLKAVSAFLN